MPAPFLTAEWRWLAMLNYDIEPDILRPYVPPGTVLDTWEGRTFVSMVGFRFLKTRLRGFKVPFYTDFEEVNLRFYVRCRTEGEWRRGVVFIKELVPRRPIAWIARRFYNENYVAVAMGHHREKRSSHREITYHWSFGGRQHLLGVRCGGGPMFAHPGSMEEFITEHYWGYARQKDGGTMEYHVEHPRWRLWRAQTWKFDCNAEALYGKVFSPYLEVKPASAFLAEGSAVSVYPGTRIDTAL